MTAGGRLGGRLVCEFGNRREQSRKAAEAAPCDS
jgi:hypothetical protein